MFNGVWNRRPFLSVNNGLKDTCLLSTAGTPRRPRSVVECVTDPDTRTGSRTAPPVRTPDQGVVHRNGIVTEGLPATEGGPVLRVVVRPFRGFCLRCQKDTGFELALWTVKRHKVSSPHSVISCRVWVPSLVGSSGVPVLTGAF